MGLAVHPNHVQIYGSLVGVPQAAAIAYDQFEIRSEPVVRRKKKLALVYRIGAASDELTEHDHPAHDVDPHLPWVHPVIDYRVHHRVGHGQPVEAQEQILHVRFDHYVLVVVRVHEERVIRQPADQENRHDDGEHSDHL